MKALYFENHGDLDQIRFGEVPQPEPEAHEALIRVGACAINHLDIWVRRGWPGLKLPLPHWCGADVAGEIVKTGEAVTEWCAGQRVVVNPGISTLEDEYTHRGEPSMSPAYHILGEHRRGGCAEYVAVPAVNLAAMPDDLEFTTAAAPLLTGMTAWRMLIGRAGLRPGESVLVVGAGGGVNTLAIQISKLAGARVYVVAGGATKARMARDLGADRVIDRTEADWSREIYRLTDRRGVDVVVDNVGRATLGASMRAAARGGRIVIVGNTSGPMAEIDIRYIFGKQLSIIGSTMGTFEDFRQVTNLLWAGRLKPMIHRVLPLSRGKEAYSLMEEGVQFGKIVLIP